VREDDDRAMLLQKGCIIALVSNFHHNYNPRSQVRKEGSPTLNNLLFHMAHSKSNPRDNNNAKFDAIKKRDGLCCLVQKYIM
jgi:hypothetical protein